MHKWPHPNTGLLTGDPTRQWQLWEQSCTVAHIMPCPVQLDGTSQAAVISGDYWCTITLSCQGNAVTAAKQLGRNAGRNSMLAILPQPLQKLSFECSPEVLLQGHHALSSPRA